MDELKSLVLRHTDPGHPARWQLESLLVIRDLAQAITDNEFRLENQVAIHSTMKSQREQFREMARVLQTISMAG